MSTHLLLCVPLYMYVSMYVLLEFLNFGQDGLTQASTLGKSRHTYTLHNTQQERKFLFINSLE